MLLQNNKIAYFLMDWWGLLRNHIQGFRGGARQCIRRGVRVGKGGTGLLIGEGLSRVAAVSLDHDGGCAVKPQGGVIKAA